MLSSPLRFWLLDETSDHQAISTIARSEILSREAEAAIPELRKAALRHATEAEIKRVIESRFELFPQPKRTPEQWAFWWAEYIDALNDLTPYQIESGMAAWVRSPEAEFMCKPGKLRELAQAGYSNNKWVKAVRRAEHATAPRGGGSEAKQPTLPTPNEERPSAEEIKALMADFHAVMKEKDPLAKIAEKRRPPPCARVDETGVSAEMRALLERQREAMR